MGARTYRELVTWQLADHLRREVIALTAAHPARQDRRFCDQLREAAESACSNTVEGFGRFRASEFGRFLVIARGSLLEVRDRLASAHERGYLSGSELARLTTLTDRAVGANTRLQQYLRTLRRSRPR